MGKFDERKKDVYYHIARIIIEEILTKNIMGMRLGSKEEQLLKRMYVTNEYSEISDLYDKVISKLVDKREIINAHMYNSKSFEELVRRAVKMSVCREDSFKITDLMMETIGSKRETYDKLIACISSLESLLKKSSSITRATEEVVEHHVEEETKSATNYVNNSSSRVIKTEKEKNKLHGGFDFFDREKRQLEKDAKKQELVEEKKSDKEIILPEEQETKKEVPEKKEKIIIPPVEEEKEEILEDKKEVIDEKEEVIEDKKEEPRRETSRNKTEVFLIEDKQQKLREEQKHHASTEDLLNELENDGPRIRRPHESDSEYVEYLKEYYSRKFPSKKEVEHPEIKINPVENQKDEKYTPIIMDNTFTNVFAPNSEEEIDWDLLRTQVSNWFNSVLTQIKSEMSPERRREVFRSKELQEEYFGYYERIYMRAIEAIDTQDIDRLLDLKIIKEIPMKQPTVSGPRM